jgi:hypothetical protein
MKEDISDAFDGFCLLYNYCIRAELNWCKDVKKEKYYHEKGEELIREFHEKLKK